MEDIYYTGLIFAFWLSCLNTLIGIGQLNSIKAKNLKEIGLKYSLWRGDFVEGNPDGLMTIVLGSIIGILIAALLSWITVISIIWGWVKFIVNKISTPDKIKEIQFKLSNTILNKSETQDALKQISNLMGKELIFDEDEEQNMLVLEDGEDGYYAEVTLNKNKSEIYLYQHSPDYDSIFNRTYKYKIEDQNIYFKLLEDKIEHPGEEYYDVKDGVILKSDIKKRKKGILFTPESKIKDLETEIQWHQLNHMYKIIFFLFNRHPELISEQDFRTYLRLKIEKIENLSIEADKIIENYEKLNEKEQDKVVKKLKKFYLDNNISSGEISHKDEIFKEAKKYLK